LSNTTDDIKKQLTTYYDREAVERNTRPQQKWKLPIRESFLKLVLAEGKQSLLEIGTGTGKDSKLFLDNGLDVVAVDLSDEMVRLCRDKGIQAHKMDFSDLSQLNRQFDAVWSMNCLLHVRPSDLDQVLSEIDGALMPSGLFHMGVYGGDTWDGFLMDEIYELPRYYSILSDEMLLKKVGKHFDIVAFNRIETETKFQEFQWHFQSAVLRKK